MDVEARTSACGCCAPGSSSATPGRCTAATAPRLAIQDATKRILSFVAGVALLWIASDWPVGLLGASYLASVHMLQYMIYTLGAAPLLLLGIPEWMARRILGKLRLYRTVKFLSRPLIAGVLFNVILIGTNAPVVVDSVRSSQFGSFALDMTWILSGLLLWLPICSTIPEISGRSYLVKIVYLFLAAGTLPMVPGGFLTFADYPLYRTYELAPRVANFGALEDQQLAGAFMKVGQHPDHLGGDPVMFLRWFKSERARGGGGGQAAAPRHQARRVRAAGHGLAPVPVAVATPRRSHHPRRSPRPPPATP